MKERFWEEGLVVVEEEREEVLGFKQVGVMESREESLLGFWMVRHEQDEDGKRFSISVGCSLT